MSQIKLAHAKLPKYFTIWNNENSWLKKETNNYDFIDRNSKSLLVTIGDSWTYGSDLGSMREKYVYGNVLSEILKSDWLNLAIPAQSNFYILHMFSEFTKISKKLCYDKIVVVCTMTGVGRWFAGLYDLEFDYINWFKDNVKEVNDFNKLIYLLNFRVISDIKKISTENQKIILRVGTNFVDQIGLDSLSTTECLSTPWYKLIGVEDNNSVYVCESAAEILPKRIIDLLQPTMNTKFKEWFVEISNKAINRTNLLQALPDKFYNCHPTIHGHRQWAEYVYSSLKV